MPILFVDPLDLWLMILGASLLVAAYGVYVNVIKISGSEMLRSTNKALGIYFSTVGVYALITGLWGSFVWPLPGGYNIVLIDPWPIFGVASLIIGIALYSGIDLMGVGAAIAPLGIPPLVYSFVIWSYRLTRTPELSGLMYFAIGVSAILSPLILSRRGGLSRALGYLAIVALAAGAIIALFIGINAAFGHVAGWKNWTPWYGAVNVTASS